MEQKQTLAQLGIYSTIDFCPLNRDDPPLNFKKDFGLIEPKQDLPITYNDPRERLRMEHYFGEKPSNRLAP